jgi:hypothetical protein
MLDVLPIKRTELVGDNQSTLSVFLDFITPTSADPIDLGPDAEESAPIDWWQHYGFLSRPPSKAEALVLRVGGQTFGIASRMLSAFGFGKLGEGDVAMYSIAGNVIRLNANGSISVLAPTDNGKQLVVRLDPKGAGEIKAVNGAGMSIEFSETAGLCVNVGQKDVTFACKNFQVVAAAANLNVGTLKTWAGASKPMVAGSNAAPAVFI